MPDPKLQQPEGELQVHQDLAFHRRSWAVQRAGWLAMFLLILAAVGGLFGPGPLSSASASTPDGVQLEYNRFWRMKSPMTLKVTVKPESVVSGEARIWFNQEYFSDLTVEHVSPQPKSVELNGDKVVYHFAAEHLNREATFQFRLEPECAGRIRGQCGLDGGRPLAFAHFVYP